MIQRLITYDLTIASKHLYARNSFFLWSNDKIRDRFHQLLSCKKKKKGTVRGSPFCPFWRFSKNKCGTNWRLCYDKGYNIILASGFT